MGMTAEAWAELGRQGESVAALTDRINQIQWFHREKPLVDEKTLTGLIADLYRHTGIDREVKLQEVALVDLAAWIGQSDIGKNSLWDMLRDLPDQVRTGLEQTNRMNWLPYAADTVPTSVFHRAFDGVFERYGAVGQGVVLYAVSAAMWISGAAIGVLLSGGVAGKREVSAVLDLLSLFEHGVLPLGLYDGVFYLA